MTTAIILAAGIGSRMNSAIPKALHPLAGQSMLRHLLVSAAQVFEHIVVVVGPGMQAVAVAAAPHPTIVQNERLGTGHAALQAQALFGDNDVAILYADNPLITPATLVRLLDQRQHADLTLLAMRPPDPGRYGRVIANDGQVERIVEYADATPAERAIGLCNAGVFCASASNMRAWLAALVPARNGEIYLTDIVPHAIGPRAVEAPFEELRGINTRAELAEAEAAIQGALRGRALAAGVTMTAPETVFLCMDTELAPDVTIAPYVVFGPDVSVGRGTNIRAFSHLEGCTIAEHASIGPYARLRPGSIVESEAHVGNFVELKATRLGRGAKANHLSYLGDATVGAGANIGAGTITCNYDGASKHQTEIGARAFIGSSAVLVAPLAIGEAAFIAAGSVITEPVPADSIAFGRARQTTKAGAARLRDWLQQRRKPT